MASTKTINIDGTRAYALLKKALERKGPDYVTPLVVEEGSLIGRRGYYAHNGKCHCPVGVALNIAGVTLAELREAEYVRAEQLGWRLPLRVKFSGTALQVFEAAQRRADKGAPWGEALRAAAEFAPVAYAER